MTEAVFEQATEYALGIIAHNRDTMQDFPESCAGPQWNTVERQRDAGHWVDGFWTGLLWLAYAHTGDGAFEEAARDWTQRVAWLKERFGTHDLGFIFYLSHVLGARLTGDTSLYDNAVQAAATLIKRYNPAGGYLQAWGDPQGTFRQRGRTNIDLMMNLMLLFWASEYTGDPVYARTAAQHARTSRLTLLRADGSTYHVADFDPHTGAYLRGDTYQGLHYASCWSRGQAWALYGFADTYRRTGDEVFLAAARRLAAYTLANLPEDLVPFWDYDSPDIPDTYRDSSAAAVTACGLLELASCEPDPAQAARWTSAARAIVNSLWGSYSTQGTAIPALLLHGSRSVPHNRMDHALIYGDYYFFEALTRIARPDIAARAFPAPQPLTV